MGMGCHMYRTPVAWHEILKSASNCLLTAPPGYLTCTCLTPTAFKAEFLAFPCPPTFSSHSLLHPSTCSAKNPGLVLTHLFLTHQHIPYSALPTNIQDSATSLHLHCHTLVQMDCHLPCTMAMVCILAPASTVAQEQSTVYTVQFSHSVVSDSVTPWTTAHQASLSLTGVYSNSCPLSQ